MKIFQIVNGFCHWQTPFTSLKETEGFPSDCIFVEAPDYVNEQWGFDDTKEGDERFVRPEAPEGWIFDEETGTFYPESDIPVMLERAKEEKQAENKNLLNTFLIEHPLTYVDGKTYGVTFEDQSEIQLNISQYLIQVEAAKQDPSITPKLEWHAQKEACTPWTYENLCALVMAISAHLYPWFEKMNKYKEQIYSRTDRKEVEALTFDYETEEEKANKEVKDDQSTDTNTDSTTTTTTEETTETTEE